MALTQIEATTPTTTEAVAEKTYDLWRLVQLNYDGNSGRLEARFRKGRKVEGEWDMAERSEDTVKELRIADITAEAEQDEELEDLLNAVIAALVARGVSEGVL